MFRENKLALKPYIRHAIVAHPTITVSPYLCSEPLLKTQISMYGKLLPQCGAIPKHDLCQVMSVHCPMQIQHL